ncbi:MAG: translocation/assembly module TamB domain-containing protein [Planctomycetota bacterium]|jgi:hypothetical protein
MSALRDKIKYLVHVRKGFVRVLGKALIICLVCWVLYTIAGNKILKPVARRQIEQLTGAKVEIESIDFKGSGFVRMNYFVIGSPRIQSYENKILRANKVDVRFSLASIFRLKPKISKVIIRDYILNVQYNTDTRQWNLAAFNIKRSAEKDGILPLVVVESGILKLTKVTDNQIEDVKVIQLHGELKPLTGQGPTYSLYLESKDTDIEQRCFVRGRWESGPRGKVMLNGCIPPTNLPILGNRWAVNDFALDLSYDQKNISIHRLKWTVGNRTRGNLSGMVRNYATEGQYDVKIGLEDALLTSQPTADALVYTPSTLEKLPPGLRKFLKQYDPRGWGDIDIRLQGTLNKLIQSRVAGTITCHDVSVLDKKFPYRLDHINGVLEVTEKSVVLKNLACKHDQVNLAINGYTKKINQQWSYDIQITSSNMLLDDDLYKALNTEQKRLWFTFTPSGLAGIRYNLTRPPNQEKATVLEVALIDARAIYQHFPYPLKNLTGRVSVKPGNFELTQVVSQYDGRSITLNGRVTDTQTERPRYNVVIDANNIPIDSTLKAALPAKQREFYESFELDALTNVRIEVFPNEVGKRLVEYIAMASIKNASLIYEKFPLPLTDVNVEAILTPDLVRLESMTGKSADSTVTVSGNLWPADEDDPTPDFCLSVEAKGLELDGKWIKSLPAESAELVGKINPTGKVNIFADLNAGDRAVDCSPYKVVIECLGTGVNLDTFPYPVENVTGTITVNPENIQLENLTAIGDRDEADIRQPAKIVLNGEIIVRSGALAGGKAGLEAYNIPLDDKLLGAMPENIAGIYRDSSPTGTVDLNIDEINFHMTPDAQKWLDFAGATLTFKECSFTSRQTLTGFNAVLNTDLSYKMNHGLWTGMADLRADSLKIKDRLVQNLRAPIIFNRENSTFTSNDFTAYCYGGKIIGDLELKEPGTSGTPYVLRFAFDNIEIEGVLSAKAGPSADEATAGQTRGLAGGVFSSAGTLGRKGTSIGRLNVKVRDMELARRSLLGKMVTAMQLNDPTDFIFSGMTAEAYLKKSKIVFEQVYMSGESMVMQGSGQLDLENNNVVLDFTASGKKITSDPSFLESLAKGLGSAVAKVEVRGNIEKPRIETSMPLFKNPLSIFGTKR